MSVSRGWPDWKNETKRDAVGRVEQKNLNEIESMNGTLEKYNSWPKVEPL